MFLQEGRGITVTFLSTKQAVTKLKTSCMNSVSKKEKVV